MNKFKKTIKNFITLVKRKELIPIPQIENSNELLDGKIALVIGGSGGIGYAITESFMKSGCKVIITGTKEKKLKACCSALDDTKIKYIILNVLEISKIREKIETAASLFEENRIDILVNCGGVGCPHDFFQVTEEDYNTVMDINAKGTFFVGQEMAKFMINHKIKGHILNVTSASALRPAWTPYQMSKWAVRGLTMGMADKLIPYGIVVNAIAPGPVATPMLGWHKGESIFDANNPSGRFALPREVASLAVFMVSDMGDLIVGDTFYITGGGGTITYHN